MGRRKKEAVPLTLEEQAVVVRYISLADKIAKSVSYKWQLVEEDEVTSELYAWLCNNVKYIISCESQTAEKNSRLSAEGQPTVNEYRPNEALKNAAIAYCVKETRSRSNVTNLNNNNYYTKKNVYDALYYLFEFDFAKHEMEGTDTHKAYEVMLDIYNAYLSLNNVNKKHIELKYKEGLSYAEIAEFYGISVIAAEKRVERAVGYIHDRLAGDPIFWTRDSTGDNKGVEEL